MSDEYSLQKGHRGGGRMHECVVVAVLVYGRVAIVYKKAHKTKTGKACFLPCFSQQVKFSFLVFLVLFVLLLHMCA